MPQFVDLQIQSLNCTNRIEWFMLLEKVEDLWTWLRFFKYIVQISMNKLHCIYQRKRLHRLAQATLTRWIIPETKRMWAP